MLKKNLIKIAFITLCFGICITHSLACVYALNYQWTYADNHWYYTSNDSYAKGWQYINGKWYYFNDDGIMMIGWQKVDGKWYYLDSNGAMLSGWQKINNKWYYLNNDMQIGWVIIDGKKYFFDANGRYIDGAKYFIIDISKWQGDISWTKIKSSKVDGVILRSTYSNGTIDAYFSKYIQALNQYDIPYGIYHYSTATSIQEAKKEAQFMLNTVKKYNAQPSYPLFVDIEENGGKIDLNAIAKTFCSEFVNNGYQAGIYANTNYWNNYLTSTDLNIYYKWVANYGTNQNNQNGTANPNFVDQYNIKDYILWQYSSHGKVDGIAGNVDTNIMFEWYLKTGWQKISNDWYYYDENGYLKTNWQKINNKWYYLDSNGVMLSGWQKINNKWYYLNNDMKTGWQKVDGKWYYLDSNGAMLSGWQKINNKWYYLNNDMKTGWQKVDGKWYYLDNNGAMLSGWQKINNKWYYLNNDMQTGWQKINSKWYYLNNDMKIGWQKVDGKWYYLDSNGAMLSGWQKINSKWYYLNNDMQTGWLKLNNQWYYLQSNGEMITGKQVVDNKLYIFASNGVLINKDSGIAPYVYVTLNGSKYHRNKDCSSMDNPIKVSLSYAQELDYTECKKCY